MSPKVAFWRMFDNGDQLGRSSVLLIAMKYVVAGERPVILNSSLLPGETGAGSPVHCVAEPQLPNVMVLVAYRIS
jgi:hypothetical protein